MQNKPRLWVVARILTGLLGRPSKFSRTHRVPAPVLGRRQDRRQRPLPLPARNERGEGYPTCFSTRRQKQNNRPLLPPQDEMEKSSEFSIVVQPAASTVSERNSGATHAGFAVQIIMQPLFQKPARHGTAKSTSTTADPASGIGWLPRHARWQCFPRRPGLQLFATL